MNPITALSGSGPAYIAVVIEAMVSAGLKVGIPRDISLKLVTKTLTGTANLLSEKKMHPAELRDAVTTPAGTTIAGIYELERGSVRTSMMNAVEAATMAAEKVAKKFESEGYEGSPASEDLSVHATLANGRVRPSVPRVKTISHTPR